MKTVHDRVMDQLDAEGWNERDLLGLKDDLSEFLRRVSDAIEERLAEAKQTSDEVAGDVGDPYGTWPGDEVAKDEGCSECGVTHGVSSCPNA